MSEVKKTHNISPFITRGESSKHSEFDKYYYDIEEKDIYTKAGIDSDGEEYGVISKKFLVKKKDISEFINSQAADVGVEAYMRALAIQGESLEDYSTKVDNDKINDFSQLPDSLADTMMLGEKAKKAFANLDPALKGNHTTIDGFLNSLSQETIDAYIKGKVDAAFPKKEAEGGTK